MPSSRASRAFGRYSMAVNPLYNAQFIDHAQHPDYKYQMDEPTMSHEDINPSCGDELTF